MMLSTCATAPVAATDAKPSPHVKIQTDRAYGSGTYIGNGYFLTANHVVDDATTLKALTDTGEVLELSVASTNALLDFAILRVTGPEIVNIKPVNVSCDVPAVGTVLKLYGNPAGDFHDLEFVYTRAEVIGPPQNLANVWFTAIPVDGTLIWGMSGGAAMNYSNELVGVNVAVQITNGQAVGFGFIISTPLICAQISHESIDLT